MGGTWYFGAPLPGEIFLYAIAKLITNCFANLGISISIFVDKHSGINNMCCNSDLSPIGGVPGEDPSHSAQFSHKQGGRVLVVN